MVHPDCPEALPAEVGRLERRGESELKIGKAVPATRVLLILQSLLAGARFFIFRLVTLSV